MPGTETFDPNGIVAGDHARTHQPITVLSGEGALVRGTVMGKVSIGAASSATKSGGNTGTGTFVLDGSTPIRAGAKVGVYQLRCIAAATNGGTFLLTDPDGFSLGQYAISGGSGGTVTVDNDIKGVITDAGTDFALGDGFDITVAAGSAKWKVAKTAAVDGSATPRAILADAVDATSADAQGQGHFEGTYASEMLTYGTGHSATTVEAAFRAAGVPLYLKSIGAVA